MKERKKEKPKKKASYVIQSQRMRDLERPPLPKCHISEAKIFDSHEDETADAEKDLNYEE